MRLALAALAVMAPTMALAQEAPRREPSITVQGEAKTQDKPDLARLSVATVTRAPTLEIAVRGHAGRVEKAGTALDGLKAKGVSVKSSSFTVSMENLPRDRGEEQRQQAVATTRFSVEVQPVGAIEDAIDALAGTGVLEVTGVSYALKDPKAAGLRARGEAMRDAIAQAKAYAEAGGFELGEMLAVRDGQVSTMGMGEQADLPRRAMGASIRMLATPPALIDTDATVTVTWGIDGGSPTAHGAKP